MPQEHDAPFHLYLASASPRRRELLDQIGVLYRTLCCEVDETPHAGEEPEMYVLRLAQAKARAGLALIDVADPHPVLGADTAVVMGDTILGKPRGREEALGMLARLSGRTHRVYSAVALVGHAEEEGETPFAQTRLSVTEVTLRRVESAERAAYWASGEPQDKAGGYAIQGRAARFIRRIEGSYSGVMGLPLEETDELLAAFGLRVW